MWDHRFRSQYLRFYNDAMRISMKYRNHRKVDDKSRCSPIFVERTFRMMYTYRSKQPVEENLRIAQLSPIDS